MCVFGRTACHYYCSLNWLAWRGYSVSYGLWVWKMKHWINKIQRKLVTETFYLWMFLCVLCVWHFIVLFQSGSKRKVMTFLFGWYCCWLCCSSCEWCYFCGMSGMSELSSRENSVLSSLLLPLTLQCRSRSTGDLAPHQFAARLKNDIVRKQSMLVLLALRLY